MDQVEFDRMVDEIVSAEVGACIGLVLFCISAAVSVWVIVLCAGLLPQ